jgi:cytochrome c oxidase assembly protein subunit 15
MLATSRSAKFFRMALWASCLALASVVFGSYMRLSEAGLGCPDWPGCYGMLFAPVTAQEVAQQINGADARKLEKQRAAQETTQRFIAGALSLVLIRLFVLGWELKKRKRTQQVLIPLAALVATFGLSAAGFATFEHRFKPLVQMMQMLGGMTILLLLWWIVLREQRILRSVPASPVTRAMQLRVLFMLVLVALQVAIGGWTMVNYAGLVCPDFPTCQGMWWPPMDFSEAFTLWRDVGLDYEGQHLNLPAATAIHVGHRIVAAMVGLYGLWLALYLIKVGFHDRISRYGLLLFVVLSCALVLGVAQVLAHLPLVLAVAHNALSAVLLMTLVTIIHVLRAPRAA